MLDLKYLRYHLDETIESLKSRGYILDKPYFLQLESARKTLQREVQNLQAEANQLAQQLGKLARESKADINAEKATLLGKSRTVKMVLQQKQTDFQKIQQTLEDLLLQIPNLPHDSVPLGSSEKENVCIRSWGSVPTFSFKAKDHVELASRLHQAMDFESAAMITGSRFVVLHGALAQLQRVLTQWMLNVHTREHGYQEVAVPYLVHADSLQATGQLPLFEADLFKLQSKENWYLVPTGEVPLTNLGRDRIFENYELPVKYVAYTPCFRSEAGSYGQDVKGMIRQHQFDKVELVHFVTPEEGLASLEQLTEAAEHILQQLELPYRVMALSRGDLGFASSKTYDLEVWLPGQSTFREISSCSYMGDFQAQRLKARCRDSKTKQLARVHTLNGSGLAVGRTLVAILENYQKEDGSIVIPEVLRPYMGGLSVIPPLV